MTDELADLYVKMRADMSGYDRSLRDSEGTGSHFESHSRGVMSSVAKAAVGLATVVGGAAIFKSIYDEAVQAQKVTAQTNAVLASTGDAAHISAGQVSELATSISNKIAVDDEAIQSAANLLLTFTNVRNEAGKGNDIFSQATATIFDMSAALGQDASSSAVQLGKALNDPITGITALRRVGVTFTEQQKEQIKGFMAHNDILSAQKIILGELNNEFGGSAAAVATPMERLGVVLANVEETIGTALLPILATLADWLAAGLPVALDVASSAFGVVSDAWDTFLGGFENPDAKIGPGVDTLTSVLLTLGSTVRGIADGVAQFWGTLTTGMTDQDSATTIERLALILRNDVWPIMQQVGSFIGDHLQPILISLGVAAGALLGSAAIGGLISVLGALVAAVASPVVVIGALVAGLVYAYQESETFRNIVDGVVSWLIDNVPPAFFAVRDAAMTAFNWINDNVVPVVQRVVGFVVQQVQHLAQWWKQHWDSIHDAVRNVLIAVGAVIAVAVASIMFVWNNFGDQISAVVQTAWDLVQNIVQTAVDLISEIIALFVDLLSGNWGKAWDDVKDILSTAWGFISTTISDGVDGIIAFFSSLPANILTALGDLAPLLLDAGGKLIGGLQSAVVLAAADVFSWFAGLPGVLLSYFVDAATWLFNVGVDLVAGIVDGIKSAGSTIGTAITEALPFSPAIPRKNAQGEYIGGAHRALGGYLAANTVSWVGERGPELFVSGTGGTVIPNNAIQGMLGGSTPQPQTVEHIHTLRVDLSLKVDGTTDGKKLAKDIAPAMRDAMLQLRVPSLWGPKA